MIPTLRIITKKSKLKFTRTWCNYTIQELLDLKRNKQLAYYYFKYTSIDYTKNILDELGITKKWIIIKPGKDLDKLKKFMKFKDWSFNILGAPKKKQSADKLKKKNPKKYYNKARLQAINHGR